MKKVRLNDKIWFGKYKGHTIKEILSIDKMFIDKMIDKGKIIYDDNILDYLNQKNKYSEPKSMVFNEPILNRYRVTLNHPYQDLQNPFFDSLPDPRDLPLEPLQNFIQQEDNNE